MRELRARLRAHVLPGEHWSGQSVRISADPPGVVVERARPGGSGNAVPPTVLAGGDLVAATVTCSCGTDAACPAAIAALDVALDVLEGESAARDELLAALQVPEWERLLAAMEASTEPHQATVKVAGAAGRLGWRVTPGAALAVEPVLFRPKKRGNGFMFKKNVSPAELMQATESEAERDALLLLDARYRGGAVRALERLIGRDNVFLADDLPVAVCRDRIRLSLKDEAGGGVALELSNLTAADYVIHLDPWWNPAVEDQATDRAHRIGQERAVTVYRLVSRGTVEEMIYALHAEKRELVEALLDGTGTARALTADELMGLLAQNPAAETEDFEEGEDIDEEAAPDLPRAAPVTAEAPSELLSGLKDVLNGELARGEIRSPATIRSYLRVARRFLAFVGREGLPSGEQGWRDLARRYKGAVDAGRVEAPRTDGSVAGVLAPRLGRMDIAA